jgi:hypothetical protein
MRSRLILAAAVALELYPGAVLAQNVSVLSPLSTTFSQTTTATAAAIAANPSRKQITICGTTTTNTLNVTFGTPVVTPTATLGIPIAANTCVTFGPLTGSYVGAQVNMIAVTGTVVVLVNEYF